MPSFQSISFPSEQGVSFCPCVLVIFQHVSNQLVSLASREPKPILWLTNFRWFPINQFPQRVGRVLNRLLSSLIVRFQSISFPSEQGEEKRGQRRSHPQEIYPQLVSLASREKRNVQSDSDNPLRLTATIVFQLVSLASREKRNVLPF